jgi:hypothetical protein
MRLTPSLSSHAGLKTPSRLLVPFALLTIALAPGCAPDDPSCIVTPTCPLPGEADASSGGQRDAGLEDGAAPIDAARSHAPDARSADAPSPDLIPSDAGPGDVKIRDLSAPDGHDAGAAPADSAAIDTRIVACAQDAGRSPYDNPCLVQERYGVFVSPAGSDSTGAGTRTAPFRTLNRALHAAKADTGRVYACDDGSGYVNGVALDPTFDGVELFGGFDCGTWTLTGLGRTQIRTTSGPALVARGLVFGVTFERFDFASGDAATGASSIAVLLDAAANVVLRKARIVAGRGGMGQAGTSGEVGADGNVAGRDQDGAPAECAVPHMEHAGGAWAQASVCGSRGGTGLASDAIPDQQAESGIPMTGVTPPNQFNGGGGFLDTPAGAGAPGNPGDVGAPSMATGTFTASGYTPAPFANGGTDGHTGQGGGGGMKGVNFWSCNVATGGAGGMGGCGGKGGLGGGGGAASVGVLSWSSSVLFDQCEIVSAAAGTGGSGGDGGKGGLGMPGGRGGARWATDVNVLATAGEAGGKGGNGGDGGSGAGGNGGPSYALVHKGPRPATTSTTLSAGAPGAGGVGGYVGGVKAPNGAIGASTAELSL